jgi:hypothetical protein
MQASYPNFFVVGAAKGGTTSLHRYLLHHPQVYMSPIKETNFFSQADMRSELFNPEYRIDVGLDLARYLSGPMDRRVHSANVERWEDYIRLFRNATNEKAVGEVSPSYLYCPSTAKQISDTLPGARIAMILRNPIDRAYSHYIMNLPLAKTFEMDFIQEVESDHHSTPKGWGVNRLYLDLGLYSEQVRRYVEHFPPQHLHVILYDDYRARPRETVNRLCQFLGVDEELVGDLSHKHNIAGVPRFKRVNRILFQTGIIRKSKFLIPDMLKRQLQSLLYSRQAVPKMTDDQRIYLVDFYREDIERLCDLLRTDLSFWLLRQ